MIANLQMSALRRIFKKKYYYCISSTLRNEESINLRALISCKNVISDVTKISSRKEMISKDNSEVYFFLGKRSHQHILACLFPFNFIIVFLLRMSIIFSRKSHGRSNFGMTLKTPPITHLPIFLPEPPSIL